MEKDNLLTRSSHYNAHTIKIVHILLWEENLLVLKNAHEDMVKSPTTMENSNNIIIASKGKPGAPAMCSLEISPDVFKKTCWCLGQFRFEKKQMPRQN